MAITLTQRPDTWIPANNPVVYKFQSSGGPFDNYRVEIEVYDRNTGLPIAPKFTYSPDSSGLIVASIHAILRSFLVKDWQFYEGAEANRIEVEGSIDYYIKYQELYTGSATSQISDSAALTIAVNSALQIGDDIDEYGIMFKTGGPERMFLVDRRPLKLWRGYPFTVSFLFNNSLPILYRHVRQYNASGTLLSTDVRQLKMESWRAINRLSMPVINPNTSRLLVSIIEPGGANADVEVPLINGTFDNSLNGWQNDSSLGTDDWAWASDSGNGAVSVFVTGTDSHILTQGLPYSIGASGNISVTVVARSVGPGGILKAYGRYQGGSWFFIGNIAVLGGTIPYTTYHAFWTPAGPLDQIGFVLNGNSNGILINSVNLYSFTPNPSTFDYAIEQLEVGVLSPCKNPILLIWKNTFGGDVEWMFEWTQQYSHAYPDGKKVKRMTLYADGISFDEFESLDGLNTPGEIYDVPVIELTGTTDKTSKKADQQVYVLQPDGTKTGVVVIPNSSDTQTKRKQHYIEIEIEFPEIFL